VELQHFEPDPTPGPAESAPQPERHSPLMIGIRYVLPAAGVIAGLIVMALGSESELEGGAGIIGASLAIYAMNWLYRASVDGDRERDQEEAARDFYTLHGRWPDERPRPDETTGAEGSPRLGNLTDGIPRLGAARSATAHRSRSSAGRRP
jgi:hypothetical protein